MKSLYFKTSIEWRNWLISNHNKEKELWLIFYKKETGIPSVNYEAAVEEALCFGWIDSIIKKIDESKYARKFTPRNNSSKWSALNKRRVEQLIKNGRMAKAGLVSVEAAKTSGLWNKTDRLTISFDMPEDFIKALNKNKKARDFFKGLASGYQKQFIGWINTAKRLDTKENRIKESVQLLAKGEKLGLR